MEITTTDMLDDCSSLIHQVTQLQLTENTSSESVELRQYSCAYCGIQNTDCLVFCNTTKKWFCNGSRDNSRESHIVSHLVRSKSNEVVLHKDGPHKDILLKCRFCDSTNVFNLGFAPDTADAVQLLCRLCCVNQQIRESDQWNAIIKERQFVPWLVKVPNEDCRSKARQISALQIVQLENLWNENPGAGIDDLEQSQAPAKVFRVQLQYSSFWHYYRTFSTLVKLEAMEEKRLRESLLFEDVKIRWEKTSEGRCVAYFNKPGVDEGPELHVMPEDEVIIWNSKNPLSSSQLIGCVIKVPDGHNNEIGVEVITVNTITNDSSTFTIKFKYKAIPYARMETALNKLRLRRTDQLSVYIFQCLLGQINTDDESLQCALPKVFSAPNLPELNSSQAMAVKSVSQRAISLIQGPPGTGKTVTSASIVYHLSKIYGGKVLAVAPSNSAVDHLCEQISLTGLKVLRVYARVREGLPSPVSQLSLHVKAMQIEGHEELHNLQRSRNKFFRLNDADWKRYRILQWEVERELLLDADVICSTCVVAGDRRLEGIDFHTVVIDEATQATEPECLIPIMVGCRQIVMVGDQCQLGPVIKCQQASKAGLGQSLFERFLLLGLPTFRLEVQYRMHPALAEFPNNVFYEGNLKNGVRAVDRGNKGTKFIWPNPDRPTFFYCTSLSQEEISSTGFSYLNRTETTIVGNIVKKLMEAGVPASSIGIITPYEGQRSYLTLCLKPLGTNSEIEIASVNVFQGREKDYIIMSCVRANENQGIGFLNDPRRLNVALTRARCGLILVGDPKSLSKQPVWNELLHFYHERNMLVEGSLESLTNYMLQSTKPSTPFKFKLNEPHHQSHARCSGTKSPPPNEP